MSNGLRIVVTGATGNVGTSVIEALAADDRIGSTLGLARRATDWSVPKTVFAPTDITVDALERTFEGADAVIHLAWLFQPSHRPLVTWRTNVLGSERVFAAAAAAGVPALVHASSIGAYSRRFTADDRVDETWPTHSLPTASYGREKAYLERVLDTFEHEHPSMRVVRMRPAFIFKRSASTEQRRLFTGPLLPRRLVQPGRLPVLPYPAGMRLQALHSSDAADAYVRAATRPVRGAFNLAAEPVLDGHAVAAALGARLVEVPRAAARAALGVAWRLRLVPVQPALLELALDLPIIDSARARDELNWSPRRSSEAAIAELIGGIADGAGGATAPLAPDSAPRRLGELRGGVGSLPLN